MGSKWIVQAETTVQISPDDLRRVFKTLEVEVDTTIGKINQWLTENDLDKDSVRLLPLEKINP